jgi:hypothetical protein
MKRKKQSLVCQHLENVKRTALEKYPKLLKQFVRRRHGVYALYRKNRLYYVGLASNLKNRLKHHLKDRHAESWDSFSIYLTIDSAHLKELESLAIRIAAPQGNRQKGQFKNSQDLRPIFRKAVSVHDKQNMLEMLNMKAKNKMDFQNLAESENGRKPVLAGYFPNGGKLRFWYKDKIFSARVKKSGIIKFGKKLYTSPSLAATAITSRPMNGWQCWRYERAPGDLVSLDHLRN